jgi:hypothetical protein
MTTRGIMRMLTVFIKMCRLDVRDAFWPPRRGGILCSLGREHFVVGAVTTFALRLQLLDPECYHAPHRLHGKLIYSVAEKEFERLDVANTECFRVLGHDRNLVSLVVSIAGAILGVAAILSLGGLR